MTLWFLGARLWFELQGTLHDDVHTYLAVGRGILNGLTPYVDLFESKPPGMFLFSALSLKFFGDGSLLKFLQVIALIVIPTTTCALIWRELGARSKLEKGIWFLTSLAFGSLIAVYTFAVSGEGLTEPVGAAACLLFAVLFAGADERIHPLRTIGLTFAIMLAVGVKEPFLLTLLAIVLLLARSVRHAITAFVVPFAIAALIGLIALTVLGYLGPYFSIYLKHMLGYHVNQLAEWNGSFPVRGLRIDKSVANLFAFSPLLPIILGALFVGSVEEKWRIALQGKEKFLSIGRVVLALYVLLLAVGTGGDFYAHHFVFAVPGYIVLFVLTVRWILEKWSHAAVNGAALLSAGILATILLHTRIDYGEKLEAWSGYSTMLHSVAASIDGVLDRCAWDRYLHLVNKGGGPFAFTTHSPEGPVFVQFNRFMDGSEEYKERFRVALLESPIIVWKGPELTNLTDAAKDYVTLNFTTDPPACARPFEQIAPYTILFRKGV